MLILLILSFLTFASVSSMYTLGYVSSSAGQVGAFRTVKVEVSIPGLQIKHKKGYYGPGN
jgi:hypothetical protein